MAVSKPQLDAVGVALVGVGSLFMYAGIKGFSFLAVAQNLVSGKPIATGVSQSVSLTTPDTGSTGSSAGGDSGSQIPTTTGVNKLIAQGAAKAYGWDSGANWDALVALWEQESSWSNTADNPSSHAYGIPQALPYTKMPKAAWPASAGGTSDAATQINWGLKYISDRYGSPVAAESHEKNYNWY